ncbi:MAG: cytochrome c3 family protein [Thermoanaerobaculales bacterium]
MRDCVQWVLTSKHRSRWLAALCSGLVIGLSTIPLAAQDNADCLMCHEDPELVGELGGVEVSVFVDPKAFSSSVHGEFGCIDCHGALDGVELPHDEELEPADCAGCHSDISEELAAGPHGAWAEDRSSPAASCVNCHGTHDILPPGDPAAATGPLLSSGLCGRCHVREARQVGKGAHGGGPRGIPKASCVDCHSGHAMTPPKGENEEVAICGTCHPRQAMEHRRSFHGQAATRGDDLAPSCVTCHKHHAILPHTDPASPTNNVNVPILCGTCHHEGSQVSITHDIPQDRILENYSLSIHGEGLFKKGLRVTAVCTSCHTSHDILPHTDPRSSISRDNVAATCTVCHSRIEEVHIKVVEGRLWEEKPHQIPSCVECHQPHKIRREALTALGASNRNCFRCHADPELEIELDGEAISLFVEESAFNIGAHAGVACAQCHSQVTPSNERACDTITQPVDCSTCHAEQSQFYRRSTHGTLFAAGDSDAPSCLDCHDKHATASRRLPSSPTYPRNVPDLCGKCHRQGEKAAKRIDSTVSDIVGSYVMSIHGKGLVEAGLVVSATCTNCHTAHMELPADDPESSVNSTNVAETCGTCHHGIEETFRTSIHWPGNADTDRELPTCENCHTAHTISRTDVEGFRLAMMNQCGRCHTSEAETFFDTYHGKVSRLGSEGAAKCYDCHGTHNILPPIDPNSTLSHDNVVGTCATCHPGAHRQFAGYLTHATHHDPDKYPFLFYSFWFMTALLVGTMTFAMIHTLAWLWRLLRTRDKWELHKKAPAGRLYERFSRVHRTMHLVMLLSFFTLALTGMTLKFSYMGWAVLLSRVLGGFDTMGILHRIAALVLIGLFAFHLRQVWLARKDSGKGWFAYIFGKETLMFNLTDFRQIGESVKWFLGRGPRPHYGRFTYWEKFDYFAVFWGVFVIGSTGLLLWFPEFFTRFLPGWSVNVATIIHSDEALLAVAFIFTIHFFNTHFRPDKFPMDPVIFTGQVSLEELKHDKPGEYDELMASGSAEEIEAKLVDPFPKRGERALKVFGFIALGIGLSLVALIVYAMLFGYR